MKTRRPASKFRWTARHSAGWRISWMAPTTRIRFSVLSSSIRRWMRSRKRRSPRRTSTRSSAKRSSSFISAQTKSGSNTFHGSAFDYRESSANLGTDPYTQFPGTTFPPGLKNQFGGSIGGPFIKDRLFGFFDYQGVRQKVGTADNATVPTAHLVSTCLSPSGCDFSEYALGILGSATAPLVYQQTSGGSVPYPGNVIPASQLSTQALALLKLLQPYAPNTGGTVAAGSLNGLKDNYSASGTGLFNNNQWDLRVDDTISQIDARVHALQPVHRCALGHDDVRSGRRAGIRHRRLRRCFPGRR